MLCIDNNRYVVDFHGVPGSFPWGTSKKDLLLLLCASTLNHRVYNNSYITQ